jgi:hypothetical protein
VFERLERELTAALTMKGVQSLSECRGKLKEL